MIRANKKLNIISDNTVNSEAALLCPHCGSERLSIGPVAISHYASDGTGKFIALTHGMIAEMDDPNPSLSGMIGIILKYDCNDCEQSARLSIGALENTMIAMTNKGDSQ